MNCLAIENLSYTLVRKIPFEKWVIMSLIPQMSGESVGYSGIHPLWVDLEGSQTPSPAGLTQFKLPILSLLFQAQHTPLCFIPPFWG